MRKTAIQHQYVFILAIASSFLVILFSACNVFSPLIPNTSTTAANNVTVGTGIQGVQVFVEPDAGEQNILHAIATARKSVWLEMYLLTDRKLISALEEAAHNGRDVRVMLEPHPYGSSSVSARETLDRLNAAGVHAQPSSPDFALTHEKGLLIDASSAYIMTCNFTLSALGGSRTTTNREYGVIDQNLADVQAIQAIFNADWEHTSVQFNDPNLVVSPINARAAFTALINRARSSLTIEAEEMQDGAIEQALIDAAKRNVQVHIILPATAASSNDSNNAGSNTLKRAGVQIKGDAQFYMHAKLIVVDGQTAFVGSENISTSSLDKNRELGIIISDTKALQILQQTFQQDWSISTNL